MNVAFEINCELKYSVSGASDFLFNVQTSNVGQQRVRSERLEISGGSAYTEHLDPHFRNRYVRTSAISGMLELRYSALLEVEYHLRPADQVRELGVNELPIEVMPYVFPSRYCQSDRFVQFATNQFGHLPRGYTRVQSVCDWVHSHLRFASGSTTSHTSAEDVVVMGSGVCRDFAHVTIALLRALNIPARFVTGYDYGVDPIWGPTDFHAYVEAYLDDRWWIFDATGLCPRNGLVRIGTGRDAADAAFATVFGPSRYVSMRLDIAPVGPLPVDNKAHALSTACDLHNDTARPVIPSLQQWRTQAA